MRLFRLTAQNLTVAFLLGIFFLLGLLFADGGVGFAPKEAPDVRRHLGRPRIFVLGILESSTMLSHKIRKISLPWEKLRWKVPSDDVNDVRDFLDARTQGRRDPA